jgi:polysaccharide pyruvyl transferase WcaK-like protein
LFARIVAMARFAGTPVAVTGAGVREGGTAAGRQLLRFLGARCTAVGVRDQRSARYFGSSAQVIGDLAYTLPLPEVGGPAPDPRFGLSMRPLAPDVEATLIPAVAECAERFRRDRWSGAFLAMAYGRGARGENDGTVYEREYRDTMELVPSPLDGRGPLAGALDGWLRTVATHRLVIATRLHAALLAVAVGVPTVAIAYERKVHDAFVDLGLGQFVVGADVDADTLHRVATTASVAREEFRRAAGRVVDQAAVARAYVASVVKGVG